MILDWTTIDDAVIACIATAGFTCYPYEGPTLSQVPCVTFVPEDVDQGYLGNDQGFGIGKVGFKLRFYVSMEKDARLAWMQMKQGVAQIVAALGADRHLGGAVRSFELGQGRISPVRTLDGGRRELMCEWPLDVTPRPN